MKTIKQWFLALWELLGFIKRTTTPDNTLQQSSWGPALAAAVERERQSMILRKLHEFMHKKPRPWWGNHVAATMRKRVRRNARIQIEKRLHSRRGLQ